MPLLRKIFFYIFVLIYLIVCPLIIRSMLGFVKDPITGHWVKTGIIYASSNPPNAKVYINNQLLSETTPTIIRDLAPNTYRLRMELDGYAPWENTIPVIDNKATSIENILLTPLEWKIKTLNSEPLKKLIGATGNNYLLVSADDILQNILILRLNKDIEGSDELEPLLTEESIYREGHVDRYFTMPSSPFFIIDAIFLEKHKYLWVDPRDKTPHIEDITELLPQSPSSLFWEPNDDKTLYAFYPSSVNRINIKAKAIYPNINEKDIPVIKKQSVPSDTPMPPADQAFLINNGNTFLFKRNKSVYLMDAEPYIKPRVTKFLTVENNSDIFFSERTGKLYYIDDHTHFLSSIQILHHKPFIPKPIAETLQFKKLEQ